MRIGVAWDRSCGPARFYRALWPIRALEMRGHEVVWPADGYGILDVARLADCDVVQVYRCLDPDSRQAIRDLRSIGVPTVWDNDDDLAAIPEESPNYRSHGSEQGERLFRSSVRCARLAAMVTAPSEGLARRYREAGVDDVRVIPNALAVGRRTRRRRNAGVTIGWVAGLEHRADAERLSIRQTLLRLQQAHPDVHVECVGVDLALPTRYRHESYVEFAELPHRMGGYDIGIAPLSDIAFNHARSDIKLKEYAACGVAWLASPITPYLGLGADQGGMLVSDDGWFAALERLIAHPEARRTLASAGRSWAASNTINATVHEWESVLREAAERGRAVGAITV